MVLPLLFSALAPTLFGGTALGATLGPAALSAIGAGLGGVAETGDLEKGLLTGLGAFAGGALLGPVLGGAGGAGADAATNAALAGQAAAPTAVGMGLPAAGAGATGIASLPMSANLATVGSGANAMNVLAKPGLKGLMGSAMDFAKSPTGIGSTVGAMAGSALGPLFDKGDGEEKKGSGDREMVAIPRGVQFPGSDYQPGISGEFDYGFGGPPSSAEILSYRDANPYKFAGGGLLQSLQRTFGPIKLAEGGIAALLGGGGEGQFAAAAPVGGNEKDVVVEAVRAIKGQSPSPEIALGAFLAQYGEDALRQLVDKVESGELDETVARGEGQMRGPGDGMDDLIPASIEGEQDVLLSDGEFVVPADVVSSLGNGSSDAGARALEDMMRRIREMKNGSPEQPPQVPQGEMLPV
jgi:hypothetical protein